MKILWMVIVFNVLLNTFIPRADFNQLRLLGNLYTHFQHCNEHCSLINEAKSHFDALLQFVANHYGTNNCDQGHDHLPLKELSANIFFLVSATTAVKAGKLPGVRAQLPFYNVAYSSAFFSTIDHPPAY